jgi:catechol 2,3-dioxygenase-like lactoylglutathione lyase family enzyme
MEILSSRVLLRLQDLERSLRFYEDTLGLAVYREWGERKTRGVVFFSAAASSRSRAPRAEPPSDAVRLFSRCATSTPSGNGWRRGAYRSRRSPR